MSIITSSVSRDPSEITIIYCN